MHGAPQQETLLGRGQSWWASLPLLSRTVLGGCSVLYALCLLSGQDDYGQLCLSARGIVQQLEVYRVFTAPLFHMSLLHVAFNMMAFVPISAAQERMHGTFQLALNLLALDLLSSAAFVTASYLLASWDSTWLGSRAVGFSGLVFGLIVIDNAESGASHRSIFGFFNVPAQLYPWALLLLWQLLLPGVSFLGHLGGVLAGEVLSRGMLQRCLPGQSQLQAWEGRLAWISGITGYIPVHGDGLPTQQQPPTGRESSWRWPQLQWRWPGSQQLYVPIPSHATEVSPVPETSRMGLPQPAQQDQAGPDRLAEPKASAGSARQPGTTAASLAAVAAEARAAKAGNSSRSGRGSLSGPSKVAPSPAAS